MQHDSRSVGDLWPRLARLRGTWLTALALASGLGCAPANDVVAASATPEPADRGAPGPSPTLLSAAVWAHANAQGVVVLVFSEPIDPTTVVPGAFIVVRTDGRRQRPTHARLAPANERHELRTVFLHGDFGALDVRPTMVGVVAGLRTLEGRALDGAAAEVDPATVGPRLVWVEHASVSDATCAGAAAALRTTWSNVLDGVEANDASAIVVVASDGRTVSVDAFDDHGWNDATTKTHDPVDDNVLELCLAQVPAIARVVVPAGLFSDAAERPSLPGDVPVTKP